MIKKLFICSGLFFVLSCQTKPTGSLGSMSPVWNLATKAQITDKVKQSTHNVTIDVFLKKNELIRLEVTGLMGYQLGSLLMSRTNLQYAIHPQKYFIQGSMVGRTLKPLFKQEIDPKILWSIIHGESLQARGFECMQSSPTSEICKNDLATVEIEQRGELDANRLSLDGQKKVTLENSNLKMVWIFKSSEVLKDSQNETFVLVKPKEYRLITIK